MQDLELSPKMGGVGQSPEPPGGLGVARGRDLLHLRGGIFHEKGLLAVETDMPETGIGMFPDVGGGYFLSRMHDGLGLYYALTGARAKAADCMAAGIATHYVPTEQMATLENSLTGLALGARPHAAIEALLARRTAA